MQLSILILIPFDMAPTLQTKARKAAAPASNKGTATSSKLFSYSAIALLLAVGGYFAVHYFDQSKIFFRTKRSAVGGQPVATERRNGIWYEDTVFQFMEGIGYQQDAMVSIADTLNVCKKKCINDINCKGFFMQTHKCPTPLMNDGITDPNSNGGVSGCYRICGYYNSDLYAPGVKRVKGPAGAIYAKRVSPPVIQPVATDQ